MRASPGFSLPEAMLVVAITGIIAGVGPPLLISVQNFFLTTTARNDIQRDARSSLDTINRFLRQARNGTIVVDTPSGQGPFSRIRFRHADGRMVEFAQNGQKLQMVINGTTTSILSRNLVYIAFTFPRSDDPSIVSVSMTMGKAIQLGERKVLELTIQKVRIMNP